MDLRFIDKVKNRFLVLMELASVARKEEFKDTVLNMPVASRIWQTDPENSPFGVTATFQACATFDARAGLYNVKEHISIFDANPLEGEAHHNITISLSSSFQEALFHVERYNNRMRQYGLTPVMGSENNLLPNINSALHEIAEKRISTLEWPDKMACMGIYDMQKFFGDYKDAPPTTMRFIDCAL